MSRFTVLELNDSEAKVLHVSSTRKTGVRVEAAFTVDFAEVPREDVKARGTLLRDALKGRKLPPAPVGLVLAKQNCIVRTATLPSSDAVEVGQMAHFEAEKFIPFNVERHIISSGIQRMDPAQGSSVLITAVDGPVMEGALAIVREAGLEPVLAEVSSIALVRAYLAEDPARASKPVLLLNIGRSQTDISILKDGLLVSTRSQLIGVDKLLKDLQESTGAAQPPRLQDLAGRKLMEPYDFLLAGGVTVPDQPEGTAPAGEKVRAWVQRIVRFIRQTFDSAAREHEMPAVSMIFLSGEGATITSLPENLTGHLNVNVQLFHPLANVPHPEGADEDLPALYSMASAWGTAQRLLEEAEKPAEAQGRINLLPPAVIEQQVAAERRVLLMVSGTMVFITLVLLYLAWDMQAQHRKLLTDRYKKYNTSMRAIVDDLDEKKKRLDIIEDIRSSRAPALVILDQISALPTIGSELAGGRLTLSNFRYSARDEVIISGFALDIEDISDFSDYLERLEYKERPIFSEVGIPTNEPSTSLGKRGKVWSFSVTCKLTRFNQDDEGATE